MKEQLHRSFSAVALTFALVTFSVLFGWNAKAQTYPVQTNISSTGPYLNYLSYYGDQNNHLRVIVTNLDFSLPPILARLSIKIEGAGYELYTDPNATIGQPFLLEPGMPLNISGIDLLPYLQANSLINPNGVDLNDLPKGFTTICVDVIRESASNEVLSTNNCAFLPIQEHQPPQTFTPQCGTVLDTNMMFHNFTWTPPVPFPAGIGIDVFYDFTIHHWIDPNNNSVLGGNSVLVFEATDLIAPTTQVSDFDVIFELGGTYVWRVTARVESNGIPVNIIENGGVSQPCTFVYGEAQTLADQLADGLQIELFTEASSERKGKAWWTVTDNTPNQGVSNFDEFFVEYRKEPTGNEGFEIAWFDKTVSTLEHFIYQLEPSTTYEVKVSGVLGGTVGDPTPVKTFTTPDPRVYLCGEADLPFLPANYTPLENATVGTQVQIGQFMMTLTEVNTIGAAGHYAGKGEIPIPFLANARAKVSFTDILIDTEYLVHEGRVDVVTEGLESWLNTQYQQFIDAYFVDGTIDSAYVQDSVAWVVVDGVPQSFVFDPPGDPIIVNDASGNQYTIYPNGTIVVGTYLSVSETWDVSENETVRFGQSDDETRGFDPKEHMEWYENYETMKLSDNSFYYVSNKSLAKGETDKVNVQFPVGITTVRFELANGDTIPFASLDGDWIGTKPYLDSGLVKTLILPSFSSGGQRTISAYANNVKVGQLNIQVYNKKEKELIVVPIASSSLTAAQIEEELKSTLGEANIDVSVSVKPQWNDSTFTSTTNISLPSEVGLLSKYSQDMRDLRDAYFEANPNEPKNKYYLFLVNGFDDPSELGYMVRGRSMGFVKASQADVLQTISHELGHGMGGLAHSWKDNGPAEGSTDNLLDYGSNSDKNNLTKAQWKELRDLDVVPSLWDEAEDASSLRQLGMPFAHLPDITSTLPNNGQNPPNTLYSTPSGYSFQAEITEPVFEICTGGLLMFRYYGTRYRALRTGYFSEHNQTKYTTGFLGYITDDIADSISITFQYENLSSDSIEALEIYRWEIIERNPDHFFTEYELSATGPLMSRYTSLDCIEKQAFFSISTPLKPSHGETEGYPLSGSNIYIGTRGLSAISSTDIQNSSDCAKCWTTIDQFSEKNDFFPQDFSGVDGTSNLDYSTTSNSSHTYPNNTVVETGQLLVDKFVTLVNNAVNARASSNHNYNGTSQKLHIIGDHGASLNAAELESIEHRLAYLYDYSNSKDPGNPIEFYIVYGSTLINGQYYFLDGFNDFARNVYEESSLNNTNAVLITVPTALYNSQSSISNSSTYVNNRQTRMPGLYARQFIDYDQLKYEYKNSAYDYGIEFLEFIEDVYTQTSKPLKLHIARQEPDGSVSKSIYEPSENVTGYGFCKHVLLMRKPQHDAINSLSIGQTTPIAGTNMGIVYASGSIDILKYQIEHAKLIEASNQSDWIPFIPDGEYSRLKEKYIDLYKDTYVNYAFESGFTQWIIDVHMATQGFNGISSPPSLNSNYYYTPSTWSVMSPLVYGTLDAIGIGLGFVGLDGITDGIGLAVATASGDLDQAATYGTALVIVGVSAAGVKLIVEYGPSLIGKTKMFFKGLTYVLKNGEWTKLGNSAAYGRVLSFFDFPSNAVTPMEIDAFITKLSNNEITHIEISKILGESTTISKVQKFKQFANWVGKSYSEWVTELNSTTYKKLRDHMFIGDFKKLTGCHLHSGVDNVHVRFTNGAIPNSNSLGVLETPIEMRKELLKPGKIPYDPKKYAIWKQKNTGGELQTFFPITWSKQEILEQSASALSNPNRSLVLKPDGTTYSNMFVAESNSGVFIRWFENSDGEVISIFPEF